MEQSKPVDSLTNPLSLDIRNESTMAPIKFQSNDITLDKHWELRPGLALYIEDALKEKFLEIPDPTFDHLIWTPICELNVYDCFKQANAFDPLRTQAVLQEWLPHTGDWDQFFLAMDLLKSTNQYFSSKELSISFAGFTLEDAKILLELDFKAPPTSLCSSFTWDTPKKNLLKHLVTKMDEMRRAQGCLADQYQVLIVPLSPRYDLSCQVASVVGSSRTSDFLVLSFCSKR
ncbi:hypothetical protein MJO28_000665 [Puccinia striiformis f. sp. tritici]|uniref:Uncharacterized protein n=1 Tax=Puccinia striiformis f. sp. tritici TaxID=168172 RepID=A0ACC0EZQ5_9BASI|nr:hypothetical protein MJO28_000665 [Puccinia striiformis f. sp. tritici]